MRARAGGPVLLLLLAGAAGAWGAQASGPAGGATRPVSRDEALWGRIAAWQARRPPRGTEAPGALLRRRRALLEGVRRYLALYPGGAHRDEAVRLELGTLFELAALRGAGLERLEARVGEYLRDPPSQAVLHEAAYWAIFCRRQRGPATRPGAPGAIGQPDEALLAEYRDYVARYPTSRYTPRMVTLLFERARRRGELEEMRRLAGRLAGSFPDDPATALLRGQLRRAEGIGGPFRFRFTTAAGVVVDTAEFAGRAVLIVVWAGFEPAARSCAAQVEAFRRARRQVVVIGVNLDPAPAQMRAACRELGIDWPQYNDGLGWASRFARKWGVRQIPRVFVIDRRGRLLGVAGIQDWEALAEGAVRN